MHSRFRISDSSSRLGLEVILIFLKILIIMTIL